MQIRHILIKGSGDSKHTYFFAWPDQGLSFDEEGMSYDGEGQSYDNKGLFNNDEGITNLNQILVEWSLDGPLPKMCPVIPTSNQDGRQAKNRKKGG
jgi:hypothetical protein